MSRQRVPTLRGNAYEQNRDNVQSPIVNLRHLAGAGTAQIPWAAPALLLVVLFFVDSRLELGVAGGVLYVAAVAVTSLLPGIHVTVAMAGAASVLNVFGVVFSPEGGEMWKVFANRGLGLFAIWVMAGEILFRKRMHAAQQGMMSRMQSLVDSRTADLGEAMEELARQSGLLRSVFETVAVGVVVANVKAEFELWNRAAEDIVGLGATDRGLDQWAEEYGVFLEDRVTPCPTNELPLVRALRDEPVDDMLLFLKNHARPDGVFVRVSARPLHDMKGVTIGGVATFHDITPQRLHAEEVARQAAALKRANHKYAIATADLERSNLELERFAFIASHDLREPARTAVNFAQLLERRYAEVLDKEGKEFLGFIVGAGRHMQLLVSGLLTLSRVGREELTVQAVDTRAVVQEVEDWLAPQLADSGGTIDRNGLPTVDGDPTHLRQLFQNLLQNALKFRAPDRLPRVTVHCDSSESEWHFVVADNGIGVPEQQCDRIFEVFRRLHAQDAYEGSGIGLALCKKIVDRHHGKIWVESVEGQGTDVHFSLPKRGLHGSSAN